MASTSDSHSASENHASLVEQFRSVTGADDDKASKMLEMCNWNLEIAINMHVDLEYQENSQSEIRNNLSDAIADGDDTVRPPIPPSREILVEENLSIQYGMRGRKRRPKSIFDGFRDFQAEAQWQEINYSRMSESSVPNDAFKKRRTLEDLFRPPLDLMHRGTFDSAREVGQHTNRWLMVNIQDSQEFSCQVLNRDVWSNPNIKNIISKHFIFWQVYCDSSEGQRYIQFYRPVEYPYVAILDPRTGENLVVWNKIEATSFCDVIMRFLNECSSPEGSCQASKPATSLLDVSEDQQIRAAMEASLKEIAACSNADDESDIETFDSDSENQSKLSKISEPDLKSDSTSDTIDVVNSSDSQDISHDGWKKYLGEDSDPTSELVLRLPDGKREQIKWPCTSKLEALHLFIQTFGYGQEKYELVTNFPRKNLSHLESSKTLRDVGLFPRETVFVQLKSL